MSQISITLPDGSQRQYEAGVTGADIAKSISEGLLRKTISAVVDGDIWDLSRPITKDSAVKFATWDDSEGQYTFWHSSAHIMAEALEVHYPGIKLAYGPPIKEGFYYDIDFGKYSFGSDDFAKVEKTFMELAREGEVFTRKEVTKQFAVDYYREKGNEYKVKLIERLADHDTITFYESGKFVDLRKGPHVPTSKIIKAVKLTKMSACLLFGDELPCSSRASTASLSLRRATLRNTTRAWKWPRRVTTASWARRWKSLPSANWSAWGCLCGYPTGPCCATGCWIF